jgi:hypothetical protein
MRIIILAHLAESPPPRDSRVTVAREISRNEISRNFYFEFSNYFREISRNFLKVILQTVRKRIFSPFYSLFL